MAASLRAGLTCLFRSCRTWAQGAASTTTQVLGLPSKTLGSHNGTLSRLPACSFGSLSPANSAMQMWRGSFCSLAKTNRCLPIQPATPLVEQVRTKVRYSRRKGKPQTVHSVRKRFYRLSWGIWIRTRAGRGKRLWKKNPSRRYRLRQHVFCNKTQSKLLDKMVTRFWRRPRYWVDDPYEPYHKRQNFDMYYPERRRPFYP